MTSRAKVHLGVAAIAVAVTAAVSSCTVPPIGRTQWCYTYPPTTEYPYLSTTTTLVPTTAAPPVTVCRDTPIDFSATTTTFVGYVAPVPAGTRTVK